MRMSAFALALLIPATAAAQHYQTDFPAEEFKARHAKVFEQIGANAVAVVQGVSRPTASRCLDSTTRSTTCAASKRPAHTCCSMAARRPSRSICRPATHGSKPPRVACLWPRTPISSSGSAWNGWFSKRASYRKCRPHRRPPFRSDGNDLPADSAPRSRSRFLTRQFVSSPGAPPAL